MIDAHQPFCVSCGGTGLAWLAACRSLGKVWSLKDWHPAIRKKEMKSGFGFWHAWKDTEPYQVVTCGACAHTIHLFGHPSAYQLLTSDRWTTVEGNAAVVARHVAAVFEDEKETP